MPYAPTVIRTRPYNFLRGLARRGHAVTLATLWQNEAERTALAALEREGIAVHAYHLTRARTLRNSMEAALGGGPLQESARRSVNRSAEEVVGGGVADVELDARVERRDIHQVRPAKVARLPRRLGGERFRAQCRNRPHRDDAKDPRPLLRQKGNALYCLVQDKGCEKRESTHGNHFDLLRPHLYLSQARTGQILF